MSDSPSRLEGVSIGHICVMPLVYTKLNVEDVVAGLKRHVRGDWGEVSEEDRKANNYDAKHGGRVRSVYTASNGVEFWVITEPDSSETWVMLPEEY